MQPLPIAKRPMLLARPAWYRAAIWIDVLLSGPSYAVATSAFVRGRAWLRIPCAVWASVPGPLAARRLHG